MTSNNYSLASLIEYCEFLRDSVGESKSKAKAGGRLTACKMVLQNLLTEQIEDVRKINVDEAAVRYASSSHSKPKTVTEYRGRVKVAIDMFVDHVNSSKGVQQEETPALPIKKVPPSEEKKVNEPAPAKTKRHPKPLAAAVNTINVQIRSDFLAQLILPLDLKASEAQHLCNLIKALPMDQL